MSEATKAVFLSYASQDAEAVRRIAEALRAAGVEVWFDQNELVGGDAWDAKIRGQIASCALFVPVISAATQARLEGYFRIEWKLAAQRTHAMAEAKPFLLPVVIDVTRDAEAHVPAEFKTVQWTKLPGGETPEKFCARVKTLLGGETDQSGSAVGARLVRAQEDGRGPAAPLQKFARSWLVPALVVVGLLVAVTVFLALGPRHGPEEVAKPVASAEAIAANIPAKSTPAPSGPTDPDLQQVTKLLRNISATADDYALAEELLKNVFAQRPTDPQATILAAEVSNGLYLRGFDRTEERYTLAGKLSERALQLAPDDPYALNARGLSLAFRNADLGRAESLLRRAISLKPDEPVFYRNLTFYVLTTTNVPESRAVAREAAQRFPRDALTFYNLALIERDADDLAAMEAALDRAIAISEMGSAILMKAWLAGFLHGNMAEFKRWLDRLPEITRTGERAVYMRYAFAYAANQPAAGLAALRALPGSWLRDGWFFAGPKDLLIGDLRLLAGQAELARENYESALAETMRQKLANPSDPGVRSAEVWTLLRLGRAEEARRLCGLWTAQLARPYRPSVGDNGLFFSPISALLQLGERSLAVKLLQEAVAGHASARQTLRVLFRSDGRLFRWRDDPEIAELLAEPVKATVATPPPNDKSVAVLAFKNVGSDPANEALVDGIGLELISVLGRVQGLTVRGGSSLEFSKTTKATAQEKGRQLAATYLVDGSVQRGGDTVRITASVTRAATNEIVWTSAPLNRDLKNFFAVQEEIAGMIAQALSLKLGVASAATAVAINPEAYRLYAEGRQAWSKRGTEEFTAKAADLYRRAIAADPKLGRAYSGLADALRSAGSAELRGLTFADRSSDRVRELLSLVETALRLEPESAEAYAARGGTFWQTWRVAEAERDLRTAIRLNPNLADAHLILGRLLSSDGRIDEAVVEMKLASELDPLSSRIFDNYSTTLREAGRYTEALAMAERAVALQPDAPQALRCKWEALSDLGRLDEALVIAQSPVFRDQQYRTVALLVRAGRKDEAAKFYANLPILPRRLIAPPLTTLGRYDEALDSLQPDNAAMLLVSGQLYLSTLDPIRSDPRFVTYLTTLGIKAAHDRAQAWRKAHPPEKLVAK